MCFEKSYIDILMRSSDISEDETCYILDTNFLLDSLRSVRYADQYIDAMHKNKGKIFIPFIVWLEFLYNVDQTIHSNLINLNIYKSQFEKLYTKEDYLFDETDIDIKIRKYFNVNKNFKDNLIGEKLVNEDINSIISNININSYFLDINNEIRNSFKKWRDETYDFLQDINSYDVDTRKRLKTIRENIDKGNITLGSEYTSENIKKLNIEAENRIENQIMPGISEKDLGKNHIKIWNGEKINSKYSDIFLWLEVLNYIENEKKFKRYVIVSNDTKKRRLD